MPSSTRSTTARSSSAATTTLALPWDTVRGLVVPVVRQCQEKSVPAIQQELNRLRAAAAAGKLGAADVSDATFTVSNIGAVGAGTYMQPVLVPPALAMGALGRVKVVPRFRDPTDRGVRLRGVHPDRHVGRRPPVPRRRAAGAISRQLCRLRGAARYHARSAQVERRGGRTMEGVGESVCVLARTRLFEHAALVSELRSSQSFNPSVSLATNGPPRYQELNEHTVTV